jgi:hypothetical protein
MSSLRVPCWKRPGPARELLTPRVTWPMFPSHSILSKLGRESLLLDPLYACVMGFIGLP